MPSIKSLLAHLLASCVAMHAFALSPDAPKPCPESSRTFEFRAVTNDPKANGETDFKGKTEIFSTDQRIAFLNAYADYASSWFGVPYLDQLAVPPNEAHEQLARIKPQPLPSIRTTLRLDDGWKQAAGSPAIANRRAQPWRNIPGAKMQEGCLVLPPGKSQLLDLAQSSGWRYDLRWDARKNDKGSPVKWNFGQASVPRTAALNAKGWHSFRLLVDLEQKQAVLSMDGRQIAAFPMQHSKDCPIPFAVTSEFPVEIRNLVLLDFVDRRSLKDVNKDAVLPGGMSAKNSVDRQPYEPVVLADDDFRTRPSLSDWQSPAYDDSLWRSAMLPCVHGGLREAGEDLFLRRVVDLPAARHIWLEIEALDPSGEIYVNGKLAGRIPNRLPILLDITALAKTGANTIALKVDSSWTEDLVPHAMLDRATGWFAGRAKIHLIQGDTAIRELLVHTDTLDEAGNARQTHRLLLDNSSDASFEGFLDIAYRPWFPHEGPISAKESIPVKVDARSTRRLNLNVNLPSALVWSPASPRLYSVSATLRDRNGRPVDGTITTTGVRTIAQKDGVLLLNRRPALLLGAQNMGMRPYPFPENSSKLNRCPPSETLLAEMLAIKKFGGNLLRVHVHNALNNTGGVNDPRIAEFADQLGLALFWSSPAWIREGDERSIDTANVAAYLRQVFNHPSIVNWELSNHPNAFKKDENLARTDDFVRKTVGAVLAVDSSRLVTPTTYWSHTHYGNDLGTIDWKKRPIKAVPEYTHPLVTRGGQDAVTGYGANWTRLREWPKGATKDCLDNRIRAWFNFEHEESTGQPNWAFSTGYPWHRLRSYEAPYDEGSIGRKLRFDEWRASQGWQAFSAYESMRKQIFHGVAGFSWCTIEGGANGGTYEKPLLGPLGHAKLAWYVHRLLAQPVFAGSDNVDVAFGPGDKLAPCVFNLGEARSVDLIVSVRTPDGRLVDRRTFPELRLEAGRSLLKLAPFRPKLPENGFVVIEYSTSPAGKFGEGEALASRSTAPSVILHDPEALRSDLRFFSDAGCAKLADGVSEKDLSHFKSPLLREIAARLLKNTYGTSFLAAAYEAYPSPRELGKTLKLGDGFSRYENITGICLDAGEHVVLVGNSGGRELALLIPDWTRRPADGIDPTKDPNGWGLHKQKIGLSEGVNIIQVSKGGNVYVSYFDDEAEKAPKVTVHFPTGKINGYFDAAKHTNEDWNRLLDSAVSPIMDARGRYIQVAYPVEWLNRFARGKGAELIRNYDTMLTHHYTLLGLAKYNKTPKNRILARVNYNYYMFRDGDGVAYLGNERTMRMVIDPAVVISGDPCWGFSHEVGHVLQMRPQMTWGGMTEVSTNLFSLYTGGKLGNTSRLKTQNNYASARKNIIEAQPRISYLQCPDVFDRLVPFWQLHLHFTRHGLPDFYADVMEEMRRRPDLGTGKHDSIRNQFEFVKICCDVARADLTDFFEKWGFFWVGKLTVNDYAKYEYTITQQMVEEVKASISAKGYPKPASDITLTED